MARFTGLLTISLLALTACSKPQPESSAPPAAPTQAGAPDVADSAAIEAALANPERLAGDRDQDGWRKAADVLRFLEVRPGMRVIDYFAGGGYYTELLSSKPPAR